MELQTVMDCGYRNASDRMVILRCCGPHAFFLERVVFPFELLSFQCPQQSEVEIWTHGLGGPELIERIAVEELSCETLSTLAAGLPLGAPQEEEEEAFTPWLQAS